MTNEEIEQHLVEIYKEMGDLKKKIRVSSRDIEKTLCILDLIAEIKKSTDEKFRENANVISGLDTRNPKYKAIQESIEINEKIISSENRAYPKDGNTPDEEARKHYELTKDILLEDLQVAEENGKRIESEMLEEIDEYNFVRTLYKDIKRALKDKRATLNGYVRRYEYLDFIRKIYNKFESINAKRRTK